MLMNLPWINKVFTLPNIRLMLSDVGCWGGQTVSTKFHEGPGIQSQNAMDTDMDTSLRDRFVRWYIPNNFERGGQT